MGITLIQIYSWGEVGTLEAFMEADQNDGRIASEYSWGFQELPVEAEWTVGNSALTPYEARANLMQAPFYNKSMRLSGPDAIANYVPFDSFRRTCSAFISGIPPIDSRGFLDHQTGFTYTNIKTVWGVGGTIRAAPDGGASTTEGVFDTDLFLKPLFNGELDGSTIPYVMGEESFTSMQPYFNLVLNATLPSEASAQLFYDHFYSPDSGGSESEAGELVTRGGFVRGLPGEGNTYASVPWSNFYTKITFEYLKSTNGAAATAHPAMFGGLL